jgi:cysteinyl-tRNA synthetase
LESSKKRLDRLYRLKKRVDMATQIEDAEFKKEFLSALEDDLNISKALALLDDRIQVANEAMDKNPKDKETKAKAAFILSLVTNVLGVGAKSPNDYFQLGVSDEERAKIEELIAKRSAAKKAKDFMAADAIRDELKKMGIELMDTASQTVWEKLPGV